MTKLHEVLAAEKTVSSAWNTLYEETLKKLGNSHFFEGHTKSLKMLEESAGNEAIEAQAAEHKALPTNVRDTLEYTFGILASHEDLQLRAPTMPSTVATGCPGSTATGRTSWTTGAATA